MPPSTSIDETFMRAALELARRGEGLVEPNPMVGCVIVRDGNIIGQGYHERFGEAHAEVIAIRSVDSSESLKGATAYVTLEPCCHHGKTPPCSEALIKAGIARVVVAVQDPFAKVNGGGLKQLTDAGIETTVGVCGEQASDLLAPYLKLQRTGRPWVIAKWAMTIDGRIATTSGESQWITNEQSRQQVHLLRRRVDAIAVGMGTVTKDNPALTARHPEREALRVATRVVFCQHRLPELSCQLIATARETPTMLVVASSIDQAAVQPHADAGAKIVCCQSDDPLRMVNEALAEFGKAGMTNVMLEGGGVLLSSFLAADQIDECHVYIGAKIFGGSSAPGPIGGQGIASIADATKWQLTALDRFANDVRMTYRRAGNTS